MHWPHNHCNLSILMVATWFPLWSNTLASEALAWMVGLLVRICLSGLHSWVEVVRLVIFNGGWMNFLSFVWTCVV